MSKEITPSIIARYSLALMVLLIVYASLYPFTGWRDQGNLPFAFVTAPWPRYWTWFDIVLNLLGYIPLGALLASAWWPRYRGLRVFATVVLTASALSFFMESLQSYLPERVSSNVDWGLNTLGATIGAAAALLALPRIPAASALYTLRKRWFVADASFGLWLLAVWPLALLTPQSLLFGTGGALASAAAWAAGQMEGSHAFAATAAWLAGWQPAGLSDAQQQAVPFIAALSSSLSFASLMSRELRYVLRAGLVSLLIVLGCAATTLSYAMSYGPGHSLQWFTPQNAMPLLAGLCASLALLMLPRRWCAALALVSTLLLLSLVNQARDDWYFMLNMQSWQQGRWIHLHGLTQWLAMIWPWLLGFYLLRRMVAVNASDQATP